jgi:hypothetical protein
MQPDNNMSCSKSMPYSREAVNEKGGIETLKTEQIIRFLFLQLAPAREVTNRLLVATEQKLWRSVRAKTR